MCLMHMLPSPFSCAAWQGALVSFAPNAFLSFTSCCADSASGKLHAQIFACPFTCPPFLRVPHRYICQVLHARLPEALRPRFVDPSALAVGPWASLLVQPFGPCGSLQDLLNAYLKQGQVGGGCHMLLVCPVRLPAVGRGCISFVWSA